MDLLLDTHVFLWWDMRDPRLGARAAGLLADPANRVHVSAVSIWEIAIKSALGKLAFGGSPAAAIGLNGFLSLPIVPLDAERAGALAWEHADPFDRMLVAQAQRLNLTLMSADAAILAYPDALTASGKG